MTDDLTSSTLAAIGRLARKVADVDARVHDQARASQAAQRSVEGGGSAAVYDEDGDLRALVGQQDDGTFGVGMFGGEPPDAPSAPLVAQLPGGATVTWDGFDANDEQGWPQDLARVELYLSTVPGALPSADTHVAAIAYDGNGGTVSFPQPSDVTTYATLVAVTTSGVSSAPSVEVAVAGGPSVEPDNFNFEEVSSAGAFLGWVSLLNTAGSVSINTASPIGGTRSPQIDLPDDTVSHRIITDRDRPVAGGQRYVIEAAVRASRTVSTATTTGDPVVRLVLHTAQPGQDPTVYDATGVTSWWWDADNRQTLTAGEVVALHGTVTVPAGHTLMRVSVLAAAPNDGGGAWSLTVDDVHVALDAPGVTVTDPATGEPSATINDTGDIVVHDFDHTGDVNLSRARTFLDAVPLQEVLDRYPRGVEARAVLTPSVGGISGSYGLLGLSWQPPDDYDTRLYGISFYQEMQTDAADTTVVMRVRYTTDGTTPTASSPQLVLARKNHTKAGLQGRLVHAEIIEVAPASTAAYQLLLTAEVTDPTGATVGTIGEGRLEVVDRGPKMPNQAVKNTGGGVLATGGSDTGTSPTPELKTYTKTFDATTTSWWEGDDTYRPSDNQYVGYNSGEGNRKSAIWFNEGAIRTALAGSNILEVWAKVHIRTGIGDNNNIVLGSHKTDTPTTNWNNFTGRATDRTRSGVKKAGTEVWMNISNWVDVQSWKTDLAGLVVGPGPSNDLQFKSSYYGAGSSNRPQLKFVYEK